MASDVPDAESTGIEELTERSEPARTPEHPADALLVPTDADATPALSIVLPTLNEEAGIAECITSIKDAILELDERTEILLSDSSDDRTPEIARAMGARVLHPDRDGYGAAYTSAFEQVRGDLIVMGDADTTYDFRELPALVQPVAAGEADICLGSRFDGEIKPGAMPPLHRYVGNPALTGFLNVFYDAGVNDAHSGFRVLSRDAMAALDLRSEGMEFASEMIMVASEQGLEIAEVPITYHPREGEATLDSFRDGWRHVRFMLQNAPGFLFSWPGVTITTVGLFLMALALAPISVGTMHFDIHSLLAGSLGTIVGIQLTSLGAFTAAGGDPIRTPSDPVTQTIANRIRLEHAASAGIVALGIGAVLSAMMLVRWITSGFTALPLVQSDVVAFTAVVVGVQIVFNAFCLSALR